MFACSIVLLLTFICIVLLSSLGCDGLKEIGVEHGGDVNEFEACAAWKAGEIFTIEFN